MGRRTKAARVGLVAVVIGMFMALFGGSQAQAAGCEAGYDIRNPYNAKAYVTCTVKWAQDSVVN
jgi:hypothetical protein